MKSVVLYFSFFVKNSFVAFRFCSCLDGLKTGKIVKDEILKKDSKTYQKRPPEWKETEEELSQFLDSGQNEKNLQRPNRLGQFIMDELYDQAKEEKDAWLAKIGRHFADAQSRWNVKDEDLVAPWDRAMKLSMKLSTEQKTTWMRRELDGIAKHIERVYKLHRDSFSLKNLKTPASPKSFKKRSIASVPFTELAIGVKQDVIRKVSREFVSFPLPEKSLMQDEDIARLRASYAYKYDFDKCQFNKSGTSFPWDVAMRDLGTIKARATGGHKTVTGEFYDHFNIKSSKKF